VVVVEQICKVNLFPSVSDWIIDMVRAAGGTEGVVFVVAAGPPVLDRSQPGQQNRPNSSKVCRGVRFFF